MSAMKIVAFAKKKQKKKRYLSWIYMGLHLLILKAPSKIAADDTFIIFTFYLSKKIRLDVSCESSAKQKIHMKHQKLFYQKNNEKIFKTVVCCSRG